MRKRVKLIGFTLVVAIAAGCGNSLPKPIGEDDQIMVIADSLDWAAFHDDLSAIFERTIETPQSERILKLLWRLPSEYARQTRWKNLIILSVLKPGTRGTKLVTSLLGEDRVHEAMNGTVFMVSKQDEYAANQEFMLLVSRDEESLRQKLTESSEALFNRLHEAVINRMKDRMFGTFQDERVKKRIQKPHRLNINVPKGYEILRNNPEEGLVWIGSYPTQRWLTVKYTEMDEVPLITYDSILDIRDELGVTLFDSVAVDRETVTGTRKIIDGKTVWRVYGLYASIHKTLGGPFISYSFYDDTAKRLYFIDGAIFAPGMEKLIFLRELEVVMESVRTLTEDEG